MAENTLNLFDTNARSEWVRLRTLILLRWMAVAGQSGALLIASLWLGLQLSIGLCALAIGTSAFFNIVSSNIYPANKRLSEREAMLTLLYDLSQLILLLFLTGGLNNPFALLIIAPVTISATALRLRSTLFLGSVAILLISIVALFHLPLKTATGVVLELPGLFALGFWLALIIGLIFVAGYARRVTLESHSMSQALIATQMALSREQKLTDLGGVVAAAAHELGTPLATIKLASSELADELNDNPDLKSDAQLIRQQADRCSDILRDMGRTGNDDLHMHHMPLSAAIQEAAEPHEGRGKIIHYDFGRSGQPEVRRHPEITHGLRNLVQNAVDFAAANVWVSAEWTDKDIMVSVSDDGPGYPADLLGRIGDPFVRKRAGGQEALDRPGYEGMGLGLFIAKTLLERSGATLTFTNSLDASTTPKRGAVVKVLWPRSKIEKSEATLGSNKALTV